MTNKCPMLDTLNLLSKKWTLCVLHTLHNDSPQTFTQLSKALQVNPRTLSTRLSDLVTLQIIAHNNKEYTLTEKGKELVKCFKVIDKWAEKYPLV